LGISTSEGATEVASTSSAFAPPPGTESTINPTTYPQSTTLSGEEQEDASEEDPEEDASEEDEEDASEAKEGEDDASEAKVQPTTILPSVQTTATRSATIGTTSVPPKTGDGEVVANASQDSAAMPLNDTGTNATSIGNESQAQSVANHTSTRRRRRRRSKKSRRKRRKAVKAPDINTTLAKDSKVIKAQGIAVSQKLAPPVASLAEVQPSISLPKLPLSSSAANPPASLAQVNAKIRYIHTSSAAKVSSDRAREISSRRRRRRRSIRRHEGLQVHSQSLDVR
jgi:hypothetical protein